MPPLTVNLPPDVLDTKNMIIQDNCDFPQGHCYGSDGGTGIPDKDKVATGRGGNVEAWTLSADSKTILEKASYLKCQFCQKYVKQE